MKIVFTVWLGLIIRAQAQDRVRVDFLAEDDKIPVLFLPKEQNNNIFLRIF